MKLHASVKAGSPAGTPKQINSQLRDARKKSTMGARRQAIMSKVFFAVEKAGGLVAGNEDGALVTFNNQEIECRLSERLRKVRLPLTRFDIQYKSEQSKRGYRVGFEVTGILVFEIATYLRQQVPQVWQETADRPLEDSFHEVVEALQKGAAVRQAWDDQDAEHQLARQRQQQVTRRAAHQANVEQAQWELLVKSATHAQEVQRVHSFVESIKQVTYDKNVSVGDRTLGEWVEWLDFMVEQRGEQCALVTLFGQLHALGTDVD